MDQLQELLNEHDILVQRVLMGVGWKGVILDEIRLLGVGEVSPNDDLVGTRIRRHSGHIPTGRTPSSRYRIVGSQGEDQLRPISNRIANDLQIGVLENLERIRKYSGRPVPRISILKYLCADGHASPPLRAKAVLLAPLATLSFELILS